MATTNQKIVSEAIQKASRHSFEAGLNHLRKSGISRFTDDTGLMTWFAEVCRKHHIASPLFPM